MNALVGAWIFVAMVHAGQRLPPRDPALFLSYEFRADGTDELSWTYGAGRESCSRSGRWLDDGRTLRDEVVATDPSNSASCASDLDMQPGRVSFTPYEIRDGELFLRLGLADEELFYVWRRRD